MATESVLIAAGTTGGSYNLTTVEGTSYRIAAVGLSNDETCKIYISTANGNAEAETVGPLGQNVRAILDASNPCIVLLGGWNFQLILSKTKNTCGVYRHT